MAERARRFCAHFGCCELTKERYCAKHKTEHEARPRDNRESAHSRGYDARWQKFRLRYLASHPLCVRCETLARVTPATTIHHIKALRDGGEKYKPENLMALCRECHEIIEGRARG